MGYSLLGGILILGASFAVFLAREFRDPGTTVRVRFPEISTLSEGDPVVENGVEAGRVESIRLGHPEGGAIVVLRLDRRAASASYARDTRFVNFSHSLMGARKVWIRPGVSPLPLDTSRVQDGVFVPGLPETLHKVRALNERLAAWREAGDRLLGGGADGNAPDSAAVMRAVRAMERAFVRLAALNASLDGAAGELREGVAGLKAFETQAGAAARGANPEVAAAAKRVAAARASMTGLESDVAASLSRLEGLAAALDADSGRANLGGRLLADRALYDSLVGGVEKLTSVLRRLKGEGLGDSGKILPRWKQEDGR